MKLSSLVVKVGRLLGLEVCRWPHPQTLQGHLQSQLRDLEVDVVFDVGANRGQYGQMLRGIGFKGLLISFEPNPEAFKVLADCSRGDDLWESHNYALGEECGTLSLNVPAGNDLASALSLNSFAEAEFGDVVKGVRKFEVPIKRLDEVFNGLKKAHNFGRPFLKLDTQGFDLSVLRGSHGVLDELLGLQTEIAFKSIYEGGPSAVDSISCVQNSGFDVTGMFSIVRDKSGAVIEMDCVSRKRIK